MTTAVLGTVIYLLSIICLILGYVFVLVALWRIAKANESIANNTKEIAEILKSKSSGL